MVIFFRWIGFEETDAAGCGFETGLTTTPSREFYDVIIVGAGPAGAGVCTLLQHRRVEDDSAGNAKPPEDRRGSVRGSKIIWDFRRD